MKIKSIAHKVDTQDVNASKAAYPVAEDVGQMETDELRLSRISRMYFNTPCLSVPMYK